MTDVRLVRRGGRLNLHPVIPPPRDTQPEPMLDILVADYDSGVDAATISMLTQDNPFRAFAR